MLGRHGYDGPWPEGADVSVSMTFDVDADPSWEGQGPEYRQRLSTLSAARFGVIRGLPRILELLDGLSVPATFYLPGATAARYPDAVRAIVAGGHEVAHHGHWHLRSDRVDDDRQRAEIEDGLAAIADVLGGNPGGYRSPAWELTPTTFGLLVEHGFAYDSSCMGDDRPYLERWAGQEILELPVHWSLDDVPYLLWHPESPHGVASPSTLLEIWTTEFEHALAEQRHVTYTMHPEVIGRGHRIRMLERLIHRMRDSGRVWFATHGAVAAHVAPSLRDGG
jgi:peptidoglycan-N-acetylglucosamine deacetylase